MDRQGIRPGVEAMRILLVEDAADIRDAFGLLLKAEGAEVVATGSGREALELAREGGFDILLTDLGLPDIPGDLLIREVLATAPPRPRIVVLTGYGEPYANRARQAGADLVLTKPVDWTRLMDAIEPATAPLAA